MLGHRLQRSSRASRSNTVIISFYRSAKLQIRKESKTNGQVVALDCVQIETETLIHTHTQLNTHAHRHVKKHTHLYGGCLRLLKNLHPNTILTFDVALKNRQCLKGYSQRLLIRLGPPRASVKLWHLWISKCLLKHPLDLQTFWNT